MKTCQNCYYYTTDGKCQYWEYKKVKPHDTCFMHWPIGVDHDTVETDINKHCEECGMRIKEDKCKRCEFEEKEI